MLHWLQVIDFAHFLDVSLNAGALFGREFVHRPGKDAFLREICDITNRVIVQLLVSWLVLAVLVGRTDQLVMKLFYVV